MSRYSDNHSIQDSGNEEIACSLPATEKDLQTNEASMLQALSQWIENRNEKN